VKEFDPKIWNIKLAESIGYIFREDNVYYDYGNIKKPITILSKVPIIVQVTKDENGDEYKYLSMVYTKTPSMFDEQILKLWEYKVTWEQENPGLFLLLPLWNPDKDFNQLMRVAINHCIAELSTDINKAYAKVCSMIFPFTDKCNVLNI